MNGQARAGRFRLAAAATALASGLVAGIILPRLRPELTLPFALLIGIGLGLLLWPEIGTLLGVGAVVLNLPGIAVTVHELPRAAAALPFLLFAAPLVAGILGGRRRQVIVDHGLLLMFAFLAAAVASTFLAREKELAFGWLGTYATEGIALYFIMLNVVRTDAALRRAVWALVLSGGLLGGLTIYQEVGGSYEQQFAGLAQRNIESGLGENALGRGGEDLRLDQKIHLAERAGGSIGDPNRYAQILIMLLPLAFFRARDERNPALRAFALVFLLFILGGALLTYSRGGFLALTVLVVLLIAFRSLSMAHLAIWAAAIGLTLMAAAPGFFSRLQSLRGVAAITQRGDEVAIDNAIRGRATEMLAAFDVFRDHPLLGVGPGQFARVYSVKYMSNPDVAFRRLSRSRRGHSQYLELAAEMGVVGVLAFVSIIGWIMLRLWRIRRVWGGRERERSDLAAAFWLGIAGYLVAALFLQLAYQRYLWLFLGLSGAAVRIEGAAWSRAQLGTGRAGNGEAGGSSAAAATAAAPAAGPR